ncbi:hypothetical protein [Actinoplanes sp. L3-i22]|uniref:hypothetical protein n=1 Tax=Actinoplanes sp. L3-i22 TaxID=2836373 RepID=UPI001C74956B|nr:hypothetical protein [Actinoplanes sp. L3-i22]BCY13402.1 hypothetical protein L3i22_084900 [Actinoplanes sp. L3-i22]
MTDAALHELLLRVAGNAADDLVTSARDELAAGRPAETARLVAAAAGSGWFRPADADLALLTALDPAIDAAALRAVAPAGGDWEFAPAVPTPGGPTLVVLDLTTGGARLDGPDDTAARTAAVTTGAVALWRVWRAPTELNPEVGRVYLVATTAATAALAGIAAGFQTALRGAGVEDPQVEVFRPDTELPAYQRLALGRSALLWARTPAAPVSLARDFDGDDPELGPAFDPDHEHLDAAEAARVLTFLSGGESLLATTARETDVLDSSLGAVVPQSFRTDGVWIWTDTAGYYLRTYGLAPDPELLAHIRDRDYRPAVLDDVERHRALVELFRPFPATAQ